MAEEVGEELFLQITAAFHFSIDKDAFSRVCGGAKVKLQFEEPGEEDEFAVEDEPGEVPQLGDDKSLEVPPDEPDEQVSVFGVPRPTRQLTIPAALGRSVANHDDEEKDVVSTPVVYCLFDFFET